MVEAMHVSFPARSTDRSLMRHRVKIALPFIAAAILAWGPPVLAQDRREDVFGVWRVARQAPQPRTIVAISVCEAENTQASEGWILRIMLRRGNLRVEIGNPRFRPQGQRNDVLVGMIGDSAIRFLVEGEVPDRSGGWNLVLRIIEERDFRDALRRGGRLRLGTLDGAMEWPTQGGAEVLAAFDQCTWVASGN